MSWAENSTVVAHKMLVCFPAGSSWCALLKHFGHGSRAWPPPISGHVMPDVGWPSTPSPRPGCSAGSVRSLAPVAALPWRLLCCGTSGDPPFSWKCLAPAVQLSARGRFWQVTRRYCLYVFPCAYVPIGYLSFPNHRHFAACAPGISTVVPWLQLKCPPSLCQMSPAGPLHQFFPLPEGENKV